MAAEEESRSEMKKEHASYVCIEVCGAKCCKYPQTELPLWPKETKLFEHVRTRDDGTAYIRFKDYPRGRCPHLTAENACGIHDKKPRNCRTWPNGELVGGCLISMANFQYGVPLPNPTKVQIGKRP